MRLRGIKRNELQARKDSKSKVQWGTIFAFFSFIFVLAACDKEMKREEGYPSLTIVNENRSGYTITSIGLVGYEFNYLNIPVGSSQTFALDRGMPGGYNDIYIIVSSFYGTSRTDNTKVNFVKGEKTTITMKGCTGAEGCEGIYLESDR